MILGAIQARLGSKRLPGKVMLPLLGKPMLHHLVERVQRCAGLSEVVVICPMKDFAEISAVVPCKTFSVSNIDENNLIERYWSAARSFGTDVVVRICADNPCIDPANVARLISAYFMRPPEENWLMTNVGDAPDSMWPQGLGAEIYSFDTLKWLSEDFSKNPIVSEHPHKIFYEHNRFTEPLCLHEWKAPLRFDVNTQEDFNRIENIYYHFGGNTFTTAELLEDIQREQG